MLCTNTSFEEIYTTDFIQWFNDFESDKIKFQCHKYPFYVDVVDWTPKALKVKYDSVHSFKV